MVTPSVTGPGVLRTVVEALRAAYPGGADSWALGQLLLAVFLSPRLYEEGTPRILGGWE